MASESGIPAAVVDRIAGGEPALDVVDMADSNFEFLFEVNPLDTGTPTVYDLSTDEILDIYDNNWLSKLMAFLTGPGRHQSTRFQAHANAEIDEMASSTRPFAPKRWFGRKGMRSDGVRHTPSRPVPPRRPASPPPRSSRRE